MQHPYDKQVRYSRFAKKHINKIILMICAGALVILLIFLFIFRPNEETASVQTQAQSLTTEADSTIKSVETPAITVDATSTPTPTHTHSPIITLQKGDQGEQVQKLQDRLMELKYMDLDESTQLYGPATKYAVELFQRQHGLVQDGIAGKDTLELIYSDAAKKYTLLEGTSGKDVDSLQRQLIDLGYLGKATGYYGSETISAVKDFQKRNKLVVDGKTGEQTLELIYSPKALESATIAKKERRKANVTEMLKIAEKQLGKPYILGDEGPDTFDCSGFVYYSLKQAGSSRRRYNAAGYSQIDEWEKISSMNDLEKGDLLFFSTNGKKVGHTGIYIGNGQMIDASSSNGKVVKRSCVTPFWKRNFVGARRPW